MPAIGKLRPAATTEMSTNATASPTQGASYVLGVIELSTAAALILGAFQPIFSALGAAMSAATYLITLTFFLSTPGVAEGTAGGLPPAHFLLKDLVLLAASLSLLFASVQGLGLIKKRLQMTTLTNQIRLQIAEKSAGSRNFLALLRWALVIIFLWFGGMNFTAYEAARIAPFIEHSPIMSWLHALFGVQGASYVIGVIELSTAAALILGAFQPIFSALGAAMSAATYLITLTFFLSTPGVAEATAGGLPPAHFLLKDLVLLAASLSLLFASVQGPGLIKKRLQMTTLTNQIRLQIAEKSAGSRNFLALLRWALVIIVLWFGPWKFTADEAARIASFIEHSPIMSWLHALFGVQGASYVIGVIELSTAAALILGAFQPIFSALGAAMSAATYLITLTFFLSTPGVAEATAGGFPAISAAPGQFLLKDLVLLAASLSLLFASVQGPWLNVQKS